MEYILEPNASFDFSQLVFISPTSLSGGTYFIRMLTSSEQRPFYIQPPKCFTKSGIMKSGKKLLCDLVFQSHDESFLEFLESLESYCQNQIFDNREKWFEPGLTKLDIENCFVSPTKTYKSGKLHSVRCNVPLRMGKMNLKIFDEQEQDVPMEQIKENTSVMTIWEIQGIRCSARSFQIDIEVKQMMTLKPTEDIFEKCMFGKALGKSVASASSATKSSVSIPVTENENNHESLGNSNESEAPSKISITPVVPVTVETVDHNSDDEHNEKEEALENTKETSDYDTVEDISGIADTTNAADATEQNVIPMVVEKSDPAIETDFTLEEHTKETPENGRPDEDLCEVNLEIPTEESGEEIKLKNPNEVYYEMYKEAKRKARIARDLAISSYLSAKQIKHHYFSEETFSDDEEMFKEEQELKQMDLEDTIEDEQDK